MTEIEQARPGHPGDDVTGADRLLEGEELADVRNPADVRHWMAVYGDLVRYKEHLLEVSMTLRRRLSTAASIQAAGRVDHDLFAGQLDGYRRRLGFWTMRLEAVGG
jgi:hypothetical protein